ncbi:MAG: alpha/beta hydrolase [Verrucomicrobiota bacterium]
MNRNLAFKILPLLAVTVSVFLAGCQKSSAEPLQEALAILEREESFTQFFATEKVAVIDPQKADYLKARNAYFLHCYTTGKTQGSPGKAMEKLERWLVDNQRARPELAQKLEDAVWLAGMELLTDRPAIPYDESSLRIERDIVYAEQSNKEVRLDLFLPEKMEQAVPCIICIHGGGFRVHRREWFAGHAAAFAEAGFAAVTIDYRKRPGVESQLQSVQDAKAAVRWVRANAEKYSIDANKIGVIGGSAGAFLTNSLATTSGVKELESVGGNLGVSSRVQAAVACAGGCMRLDPPKGRSSDKGLKAAIEKYGREMIEKFSPHQQVDADDPPILLIHGSEDKVVPVWQSEDLFERYQEVGASATLEIIEGGKHTFYLSKETVNRAIRFFREELLN